MKYFSQTTILSCLEARHLPMTPPAAKCKWENGRQCCDSAREQSDGKLEVREYKKGCCLEEKCKHAQ